MIEIMDRVTGHKMMMLLMCGIRYQNDSYLIYCIRRGEDEVNVFVSKLLKGSMGYLISDDFSNGEKEVIDGVVKRIINKESKETIERDGFVIISDINMDNNLVFDIDKCYVCTVLKSVIKDCLVYYDLVSEKILNQPVVEVIDDNRKFSDGFVSSLVLIVVGVVVSILTLVVVINFFVS